MSSKTYSIAVCIPQQNSFILYFHIDIIEREKEGLNLPRIAGFEPLYVKEFKIIRRIKIAWVGI